MIKSLENMKRENAVTSIAPGLALVEQGNNEAQILHGKAGEYFIATTANLSKGSWVITPSGQNLSRSKYAIHKSGNPEAIARIVNQLNDIAKGYRSQGVAKSSLQVQAAFYKYTGQPIPSNLENKLPEGFKL